MAGTAMLKTAGGNVRSEWESTDAEKRSLLTDQDSGPDFFDHWLEEYASKAAIGQLRTKQQRAEEREKTKVDGKGIAEPGPQ
jgi:hypothetical protein